MVLAGTLIGASFLSAFFISSSSNRSTPYWSARVNLIAGNVLTARNIEAVPVALNQSGDKYLTAKSEIVGTVVVRNVKKGELLPLDSLSSDRHYFDFVSLPISVKRSDLPKDLIEGELVNVYQVGDPNLATSISQPILVLSKVSILGIDKSGSNMGGSQTLTLSTRASDVLIALKATAAGRLVIIRVNG
jgi:hypothetical protein